MSKEWETDAERLRQRAAVARMKAKAAAITQYRQHLEGMAEFWTKLAEEIEFNKPFSDNNYRS